MAKCKHPRRYLVDLEDSVRCRQCTRHLPMGPSNDDVPPEEILAAELGQNPGVWEAWQNCDLRVDDGLSRLGVRGFLQIGAFSPDAQHAFMTPLAFRDELDRIDYWAGWLARDIAGSFAWGPVETDEAWSWDPSRPVAGQHEEHMARGDAQLDDLIAEQTRHDVAASVVRHDALLTDAEAAAIIAQSSDLFAPVDTASREPWHADAETQASESGADDEETKLRETVA